MFSRAYTARRSVASSCLTLYVLHRFKPKQQAGNKRNNREQTGVIAKNVTGSAVALDSGVRARSPLKLLVGFAIAKKMLKSACRRNRCKRRVREAYRAVRSEGALLEQITEGANHWYALVFVLNPVILDTPFEDLKACIRDCLLKAHKKYGRPQ